MPRINNGGTNKLSEKPGISMSGTPPVIWPEKNPARTRLVEIKEKPRSKEYNNPDIAINTIPVIL